MSNYFVLSALYASLWAHSTPRINGNYVNSHFKTPFGKAHLFMINFIFGTSFSVFILNELLFGKHHWYVVVFVPLLTMLIMDSIFKLKIIKFYVRFGLIPADIAAIGMIFVTFHSLSGVK